METKSDLIQTAALLYQLGVEVEKARQDLKKLVESGVPYESNERIDALRSFQQLDHQWKQTEQEYFALRQKVLKN